MSTTATPAAGAGNAQIPPTTSAAAVARQKAKAAYDQALAEFSTARDKVIATRTAFREINQKFGTQLKQEREDAKAKKAQERATAKAAKEAAKAAEKAAADKAAAATAQAGAAPK